MGPKLQVTKDYSVFELHECNRPLHEKPDLAKSMAEHGFMPSSPLQCVHSANGKLKVIRGHHRLHYAKRLKIPVWYIIDDSVTDIFALEGGYQQWSVKDFAEARAKAGDKDCKALLEFTKQHELTIGSAASLLGGESAGSGNKSRGIKAGSFRVVADQSHAKAVVAITDRCRLKGILFATASAFVTAISLSLRVPEFDDKTFAHRVELYAANLRKRGTVTEYLEEIDALYNYAAKGKRIPLAFRAREVARTRHETFGKNVQKK